MITINKKYTDDLKDQHIILNKIFELKIQYITQPIKLIIPPKVNQLEEINYDNDIIDWFKSNYELTNNKELIIRVQDIYKNFKQSIFYNSKTTKDKKKYNFLYFLRCIESSDFFYKYYYQKYKKHISIIKCWKIKVEESNDIFLDQ
jgi:hypothetical protein